MAHRDVRRGALLLAAVGLYGVMGCTVARRAREIGIRMALGARPSDAYRLIVGQGMALTGLGLAAGIVLSLMLTQVMEGLLFEVSPTDPATVIGMVVLLAVVAFAACVYPARRGTRIDPVVALREE